MCLCKACLMDYPNSRSRYNTCSYVSNMFHLSCKVIAGCSYSYILRSLSKMRWNGLLRMSHMTRKSTGLKYGLKKIITRLLFNFSCLPLEVYKLNEFRFL